MAFGFNPYIARVAGEAFGDPCTPNCETCGRDEYACWCEPETGYAYPIIERTPEEKRAACEAALAKFAEVFAPNFLELEARRNDDGSYSVAA